jgi:serine/threonine protein kinase
VNALQTTFRAGHLIQAQYRVIELLGQGVSGAVYLVADESTHQSRFALKEVMQAVREERGGFDAAALKRLDHLALPCIHRVFHSDNRLYILMDYVEGSNLEAIMRYRLIANQVSEKPDEVYIATFIEGQDQTFYSARAA